MLYFSTEPRFLGQKGDRTDAAGLPAMVAENSPQDMTIVQFGFCHTPVTAVDFRSVCIGQYTLQNQSVFPATEKICAAVMLNRSISGATAFPKFTFTHHSVRHGMLTNAAGFPILRHARIVLALYIGKAARQGRACAVCVGSLLWVTTRMPVPGKAAPVQLHSH